MKVLIQSRKNFYTLRGGDTVQLLKTKEELEKLGVDVDISLEYEPDLTEYDIVPAWFLWYGWGVTIIPPGMIIITVRKPIWSGSRPEAYHRPFPPPVPVSPKAIRSGREPIQRCF